MLGNVLRKKFEKTVTHPLGVVLAKTGLTPNTFTMISLPIALGAAYFIYFQDWPMALALFIISIFWDNLDGAMARASGQVTKFGSYLDYMIDKHVELIIYVAFAFTGYPIEAIIAASFNMLNSVAKPATAIRIPIGNEDWPAIGERADRMLVLMLGMFAAIFYTTIAGYDTISIALLAVAAISLIGTYQRMLFARDLITKYEKTGKKQMVRK